MVVYWRKVRNGKRVGRELIWVYGVQVVSVPARDRPYIGIRSYTEWLFVNFQLHNY
jgi:hypothetical protein